MTEEEKRIYENTVHNLRSQGWSKIEAEDEALRHLENHRRVMKMWFAEDRNPDNA